MKKPILIAIIFLMFTLRILAQFESFEFDCDPPAHAFVQGCFTIANGGQLNWINTHGTADNRSLDPSTTAYHGEKWAHMYIDKNANCSNPDRGEGVAIEFDFQAGLEYTFNFAIKGSTAKVQWILTDGLPNNSGFGSCDPAEIVPAIPTGSQSIWEVDFFQNTSSWVYETICFTADQDYSQLWLRMSNINYSLPDAITHIFLDAVSIKQGCDEPIVCTTSSDLSACEDEEDFGFIQVDCTGTFNWDFPSGSTAIEFTSADQSLIVNASAGEYSVTVTASNGSTFTETFLIEDDCCPVECQAIPPAFLSCQMVGGQAELIWTDVPGAIQYQINIFINSPYCGCEGQEEAYSYIVDDSSFPLSPDMFNSCFAWQVRTICEGKEVSDFSELSCHYYGVNCDEPPLKGK